MPAGYIYQGEDQYLLKVGDEYASDGELESSVLCNIDGIGDIRVSDVADVTWIDNSGDAYAKVNGRDGIVFLFQNPVQRELRMYRIPVARLSVSWNRIMTDCILQA